MKKSYILKPSVYNDSSFAELHLIIVYYKGLKLGVLATVFTLYYSNNIRKLQCEALGEFPNFEIIDIIERIKKEISDGNIDKAFAFDMPNSVIERELLAKNKELFKFDPYDTGKRIYIEHNHIQKLLDAVRDDYITQ